MLTDCSTLSSPPNPAAWAWAYRSAARSSMLTEDDCPSPEISVPGRRSCSLCHCIRRTIRVIGRPTSPHSLASAEEPIVFVIDDDASVREALRRLFRSIGLRVEVVGSAHEFLQSKVPN